MLRRAAHVAHVAARDRRVVQLVAQHRVDVQQKVRVLARVIRHRLRKRPLPPVSELVPGGARARRNARKENDKKRQVERGGARDGGARRAARGDEEGEGCERADAPCRERAVFARAASGGGGWLILIVNTRGDLIRSQGCSCKSASLPEGRSARRAARRRQRVERHHQRRTTDRHRWLILIVNTCGDLIRCQRCSCKSASLPGDRHQNRGGRGGGGGQRARARLQRTACRHRRRRCA